VIFTDFTYTEEPADSDRNTVHKSEFEVGRAYNVTGASPG
jgi:hypothetical protein